MNVEGISNVNVNAQPSKNALPQADISTAQISKVEDKQTIPSNSLSMSDSLIDKGIEKANEALKPMNRAIERSVHDVTKAIIFKIVDTDTQEVLREFPPEKIQDMIAKMWELAGLFVDEKA